MQEKFISLLYPNEESHLFHSDRRNLPKISESVCDELGLNEIFNLKNCELSDFFTADCDVIAYRQATLSDMLNISELKELLFRVQPILDDILELQRLEAETSGAGDSYLYSITEIELYVSCINKLYEGFGNISHRLQSPAFKQLSEYISELCESEYFRELIERLNSLASRVREVRSITVGVNLDAELRPQSAGVISINSERFKSGKVLDKILRLSFKNDAYTSIADLTPFGKGQSENRQEALIGAFNSAIEEVFRSSVRGWRSIVADYVLDNTDFLLKIAPEIEFVSRAVDLLHRLADVKGESITLPTVAPKEEKAFSAVGLYNPRVALAVDGAMVLNDVEFDDNAKIYVITGPNRGGKSVITVAVGAAQAMFQLGLPVPAATARMSVVDGIFTHFPEGADDTIDKGRLGEECARLGEIFAEATEHSMILLDESLSSTGAYEASYIAAEILAGFAVLGCRGIFSTHLHELAASIPEINARSAQMGGVMTDTLVAGIEDGERSFKIYRAKPDGKSYAKDIADKYGLSFESILKNIGKEIK